MAIVMTTDLPTQDMVCLSMYCIPSRITYCIPPALHYRFTVQVLLCGLVFMHMRLRVFGKQPKLATPTICRVVLCASAASMVIMGSLHVLRCTSYAPLCTYTCSKAVCNRRNTTIRLKNHNSHCGTGRARGLRQRGDWNFCSTPQLHGN